MIFPNGLTYNNHLPIEILKIIKSYLNPDDAFNINTFNMIQILKQPYTYDIVARLPSYYDRIRKSQLSRKHGFHWKWKRVEVHRYPNVHQYRTKKVTWNRENSVCYHLTLFDTTCGDNKKPYTERTCRLKISLLSCMNYDPDTYAHVKNFLNQQQLPHPEFQTELSDNYIWIWRRERIVLELYEQYQLRYENLRNIKMMKEMDLLCFQLNTHMLDYFQSPFFMYIFESDKHFWDLMMN